jgi:hypothetical protein
MKLLVVPQPLSEVGAEGEKTSPINEEVSSYETTLVGSVGFFKPGAARVS